jgi:hypothetical protein
MADEEQTPPAKPDRIYDRTTDRVAGMSDEARVALHRKIHGGKETVPDKGFGTPTDLQYGYGRPAGDAPDPSAEVIRLEAELHRTERRIERIERGHTRERFQATSYTAPHGRYARLLSRADRLERQLRELQ